MAYIVPHGAGRWEIREAHATSAGPRSTTLASFGVLTSEVVEQARRRSSKPFDREDLRRAAARVGAPVAPEPPDRASGELLAELAAGRYPRPVLRRLLLELLQNRDSGSSDGGSSDSALAASGWIGATPRQRGDALRDLLLLADRLPARRRARQSRFPRIQPARP
jgi:hypothetical protein